MTISRVNLVAKSLGFMLIASVSFAVAAGAAKSETITFSEINPNTSSAFSHGDVWGKIGDGDTIKGVTFSVDNFHAGIGDLNEGRIFDTNQENTEDPDLEDPWTSGGNLGASTDLGRVLIIQEHDAILTDDEGDQGSTGAGSITLEFTTAITSFGLDLADIENGGTTESQFGFLQFFDGTISTAEIFFSTFTTQGGAAGDAVFGDNRINRVNPLLASAFGFASFDKVVVKLQGSGAIDNLTFTEVPLPAAWLLLGSGLAGLGIIARRRRHNPV